MILPGFIGGGFECATHVRADGTRLDLVVGTGHDCHAAADYALLKKAGLSWARDGLRWHLLEPTPGARRWDTWRSQLEAAARADVQVWWDLIHFGLPDWCDVWASDFPHHAAAYAADVARYQLRATGRSGRYCPINEISFMAFAGGEMGWMHPHARGAGAALKERLLVAALAMARAIRSIDSGARFLWSEPLIHVAAPNPDQSNQAAAAMAAQHEAMDWLGGWQRPELGGTPDLIDLIGLNYYPHNQHMLDGGIIGLGMAHYRPLSSLLSAISERYPMHPLILAETGAEGCGRAAWLTYIAQEAALARNRGIPLLGACLYPVTDYPGWDDGRPCPTGLFGSWNDGSRHVDPSTWRALQTLERSFGRSVTPSMPVVPPSVRISSMLRSR